MAFWSRKDIAGDEFLAGCGHLFLVLRSLEVSIGGLIDILARADPESIELAKAHVKETGVKQTIEGIGRLDTLNALDTGERASTSGQVVAHLLNFVKTIERDVLKPVKPRIPQPPPLTIQVVSAWKEVRDTILVLLRSKVNAYYKRGGKQKDEVLQGIESLQVERLDRRFAA